MDHPTIWLSHRLDYRSMLLRTWMIFSVVGKNSHFIHIVSASSIHCWRSSNSVQTCRTCQQQCSNNCNQETQLKHRDLKEKFKLIESFRQMLYFIILNIRIKHVSERMALAPFYWWEAETANQQMKKRKTKRNKLQSWTPNEGHQGKAGRTTNTDHLQNL